MELLPFDVTLELPRQVIRVWARDDSDAAWRAYHMLGLAGMKKVGTINAERLFPESLYSEQSATV